ncbi:monocarboxylate transporter 9-like [Ruditapes philippinarum]|uniref:monocarboxylate transporter 9-like n=1 Tax=Ruditapes philippinarum TaxID=129788 RepID=UPI00295A6F11|nr:monocarboxylate transporter 9-like [Ruditapes philippinarum]
MAKHSLLPVQNRVTQNEATTVHETCSTTLPLTISEAKTDEYSMSTDMKRSNFKQNLKSSDSYPVTAKRTRLLDLSLFKSFAFCALCIQLFLFTLSLNSTFVFLPALAEENGVTPVEGAYLVSLLGILDGVSRLVMSSVLDFQPVKPYRLLIYNIVMFFVAIVSVLIPSMKGFWQFAVVSGLYGILSGAYMSQKSVVVVDILGADSLSSSLGFLLFFQGIGGLVGPTVGGLSKDYLDKYDMVFYFGSLGIATGGITMAAGNIWLYRQRKKKQDHVPVG